MLFFGVKEGECYESVGWMLNILQTLQCLYNCIELNCVETCRILAGNVKYSNTTPAKYKTLFTTILVSAEILHKTWKPKSRMVQGWFRTILIPNKCSPCRISRQSWYLPLLQQKYFLNWFLVIFSLSPTKWTPSIAVTFDRSTVLDPFVDCATIKYLIETLWEGGTRGGWGYDDSSGNLIMVIVVMAKQANFNYWIIHSHINTVTQWQQHFIKYHQRHLAESPSITLLLMHWGGEGADKLLIKLGFRHCSSLSIEQEYYFHWIETQWSDIWTFS